MRFRVLAVSCSAVVMMTGCSQSTTAPAPGLENGTSPAVSVVASAYPLAYASGEVGKARVSVKDLTPPGAEPHDIELTPADVAALQEAGLIVMVGGGFQPSIEKSVAGLPSGSREVYDALAGLTPIIGGSLDGGQGGDPEADEPGDAHGHEEPGDTHGHEGESELDPHFWLDPKLMAEAGKGIAEKLARLDPAGGETYLRNTEEFRSMLNRLDSEFESGLKTCKRRTIIVAHAAYGYLAERYALNLVPLSGLSPHAEPTPASLADARRVARETGATMIFTEPGKDAGAAETLARDIGGSTAELDPIEIQQPGTDYPAAMRANLAALRKALECD